MSSTVGSVNRQSCSAGKAARHTFFIDNHPKNILHKSSVAVGSVVDKNFLLGPMLNCQ